MLNKGNEHTFPSLKTGTVNVNEIENHLKTGIV